MQRPGLGGKIDADGQHDVLLDPTATPSPEQANPACLERPQRQSPESTGPMVSLGRWTILLLDPRRAHAQAA